MASCSLSATVNPDFGRWKPMSLVVNFDATETFISDKRPFFTENQGIFEFTTPLTSARFSIPRRIGGPADDGQGSADITGAVKLNGSIGATKYGVFAADEADAAGRFIRRAAPGARLQGTERGPARRPESSGPISIEPPAWWASITTGGRRRAGMFAPA